MMKLHATRAAGRAGLIISRSLQMAQFRGTEADLRDKIDAIARANCGIHRGGNFER
jgi:hypothetical protein